MGELYWLNVRGYLWATSVGWQTCLQGCLGLNWRGGGGLDLVLHQFVPCWCKLLLGSLLLAEQVAPPCRKWGVLPALPMKFPPVAHKSAINSPLCPCSLLFGVGMVLCSVPGRHEAADSWSNKCFQGLRVGTSSCAGCWGRIFWSVAYCTNFFLGGQILQT